MEMNKHRKHVKMFPDMMHFLVSFNEFKQSRFFFLSLFISIWWLCLCT